MNKRRAAVAVSIVLAVTALLYLGGVLGQLFTNYGVWLEHDGITGQVQMEPVDWNPIACFPAALTLNGVKGMALVAIVTGGLIIHFKLQGRFGGKDFDPRGFKTSSTGAYGTAGWMNEKEMQSVLEISSIDKAKGTILGEHRGKAVCMPEDTRLNRHIAVFGASGTMKSRAVIRNALFQAIKRGESVNAIKLSIL